MIITEEYKLDNKIIEIVDVHYYSGHKLAIKFNDGKENIIDFGNFIFKNNHPSIDKYRKIEEFRNYKIVDGNLNWNDYDMIFSLEDLYDCNI